MVAAAESPEMEVDVRSGWVRGAVIGAGSFGRVSLAVEKSHGRLFAVKSIDVEARSSEIEALENEQSILSGIDSPHVVRCFGGGLSPAAGGRDATRDLYLEYMPGGSLVDLSLKLGGGGMEEELVRAYTLGILQGLAHIHGKGIVHCDIKGKNVLVGGAAGVKLADFGSAKRADCHTDAIRGTPLFMAPEVIREEEQSFTSDIWSLGCTVVEMITGKAPWSASDSVPDEGAAHPLTLAVLRTIGYSDEVPQVPVGKISSVGRDFLEKCLCRDASKRLSATELLGHPFVSGQSPKEKPAASPPVSPRSPLDFSRWQSSWCSSPSSSPASSPRALPLDLESNRQGKWLVVHSPRSGGGGACSFTGLSDFSVPSEENDQQHLECIPEAAEDRIQEEALDEQSHLSESLQVSEVSEVWDPSNQGKDGSIESEAAGSSETCIQDGEELDSSPSQEDEEQEQGRSSSSSSNPEFRDPHIAGGRGDGSSSNPCSIREGSTVVACTPSEIVVAPHSGMKTKPVRCNVTQCHSFGWCEKIDPFRI